MELMSKPTNTIITTTFFFLLLLLVAAAAPHFSTATGKEADDALVVLDSEEDVYEIDYRGPETHSRYTPPPHRSAGRLPLIHGQTTSSAPSKSKGLRGGGSFGRGGHAKKVHG